MWNFSTGNIIDSAPFVADGVVCFGSEDGNVYALNATTGVKIWSFTTQSAVESSPSIVNGVVYVGSDDNNVYAFGSIAVPQPSPQMPSPSTFTSPFPPLQNHQLHKLAMAPS